MEENTKIEHDFIRIGKENGQTKFRCLRCGKESLGLEADLSPCVKKEKHD